MKSQLVAFGLSLRRWHKPVQERAPCVTCHRFEADPITDGPAVNTRRGRSADAEIAGVEQSERQSYSPARSSAGRAVPWETINLALEGGARRAHSPAHTPP